ncbi:NUDIX domain-containing protein [Nocardia carnea]|uniref:NUDIX domain-containing protein n=1 Tax=Nocardia carnea TaxID=37328 RepID=UPI003570CCA2
MLETAAAVYVVPLTTDHQILMLRQYRQTLCQWGWELPAGSMFDHTGDPEDLAAQGLREEAGAIASRFEHGRSHRYCGRRTESVVLTTTRRPALPAGRTRSVPRPAQARPSPARSRRAAV